MTTSERKPVQVWVDTQPEIVDKAREIAREKHMTFRGFIASLIEKAVEAESDKVGD